MGIKIVIIDQGVDPHHDRLKNCRLSGLTVHKSGTAFTVTENAFGDDSGHGTAIAGIIHRIVPGVEIVAVKLSSDNRKITEDLLCEGIRQCAAIPGVKVVNISLGIPTNTPSSDLHDATRQLCEAGNVVVAAAHNFPYLDCYPAYFPFVYSVSCGLVKNKLEYGYLSDSKSKILARGTTQRVPWLDNGYKITAGTSYATAHFTGIVARLIKDLPAHDPAAVRDLIVANATPNVQELTYTKKVEEAAGNRQHAISEAEADEWGRRLFTAAPKIDFADKLALFPASDKEMNTLLEFRQECQKEIRLCIDYPRAYTNIIQVQSAGQMPVVRRELLPHEYDAFDTLVVGYFLDIPVDSNILFATNLLNRCIALNKNFVVLDREVVAYLKQLISKSHAGYTGTIYLPEVNAGLFGKVYNFRYLPRVKTPTIALIGTGSKQGKITTQLRIRQVLREEGYGVSLISTEPQGSLLGADFVFPFGHKSIISLDLTDWASFLSIVVRGVQKYNQPDVILTGIQGGILPRVHRIYENPTGTILSSLHYLLGIQPDAVVCAINPMDPVELVEQTLRTIHNYCKADVLFCTMTPWVRKVGASSHQQLYNYRRLTPEEMQRRLAYYTEALGVPVIDIMDRTNDEIILNTIQQYFSEEAAV